MASSIQGLSPSLPLRVDEVDGPYALNKTIKEMAKQNLRVLFFTVPGERIWNRNFGRPDMSENGLIIRFTYVISPYNVADTIFINSDGPIEGIPSSQLLNVP